MRILQLRGATAPLAVLGLTVLLAGCSWVPFVGKKSDKGSMPACPVAVILHPLANTVVFNQPVGETKPINVAFYGVYSDISAKCTMSGDTLHATLDNVIVAERGPANHGNDLDLDYFVSLTGSDQTILGKKSFAVHVTLAPNAKRAGINDHVEIAFATGGRPLSDLNITVGFQESPQAIEFYKNYRGR